MHSGHVYLGPVGLHPPLKLSDTFKHATVQRQPWTPHLLVYLVLGTLRDGPSWLLHITTQLPLSQRISTSCMERHSFVNSTVHSEAVKTGYLYRLERVTFLLR